jgi:hypothetical protein
VCSRLADPLLVFADCGVAIRETYNTLERFAQPYAKARLLIGHSHSFQAVKRILLFGLYWNGPKNRPARIYSENRTDPYLCLDWWNFLKRYYILQSTVF